MSTQRTTHPYLFAIFTVAVLVLVSCTPPNEDPFYLDNATPLPDGKPGDIIASRQSSFTINPTEMTQYPGVKAWQVIYQSENSIGEAIAVSGTVLVPTIPWLIGERPIIGYTVGTRGLGDACAPSYTLSKGEDYEGPFITMLLDKGWAVAITDYEGLGMPGGHPYMIGASQGPASLNMVRAAQRLPEAGLSADAPVGLMGYSQGGGAAGAAAELASTYAPELNIVAAAPGGVPGDLKATGDFLDGSMSLQFIMIAARGLDVAYPDLDLDGFLNDEGRTLRANADDFCIVSVDGISQTFEHAYTNIDDYVTSNPLKTQPWLDRLEENRLGKVKPEMPVFLYHPIADQIVPFDQAAKLRKDWCDLGATVEWVPLPAEHLTGMVQGYPLAVEWMEARFAGIPSLGDCLLQ